MLKSAVYVLKWGGGYYASYPENLSWRKSCISILQSSARVTVGLIRVSTPLNDFTQILLSGSLIATSSDGRHESYESCPWLIKLKLCGRWEKIRVGLRWLTQHNQTIHCLRVYIDSSSLPPSQSIPATNVSSQYWIPRSKRYRKATETSTKYSSAHRAFLRPYHWPRQCGKDNHPPASLQYNRTAKDFQSGGSWGIPCSRYHQLSLLMWIDWLVRAQSNCTGNVDLQSLLLFTEGVAERGAWYWEWNDIWE